MDWQLSTLSIDGGKKGEKKTYTFASPCFEGRNLVFKPQLVFTDDAMRIVTARLDGKVQAFPRAITLSLTPRHESNNIRYNVLDCWDEIPEKSVLEIDVVFERDCKKLLCALFGKAEVK